MYDLIYNYCVIHGTPRVINSLYQCIDTEQDVFHLDYIYPPGATCLTDYNNATIPLELNPDIHTTFDDILEDWRKSHWGTPYNPYGIYILYHTPTTLIIAFTTDDKMPHTFFATLKSTYGDNISVGCYGFNDDLSDTVEVYGDDGILNNYFTVCIDEEKPYSRTDNGSFLFSIERQDISFNLNHASH